MKEEYVDVFEIWMPVDIGGEAYNPKTQKGMKLVAFIVDGRVLKLEEGFMLEKRKITKEEEKHLK